MKTVCTLVFLIFLCSSGVFAQSSLQAVDDTVTTGPFQAVKKNVVFNDKIPNSNYKLEIVTALDPATQGKAVEIAGEFIEFTPGPQCHTTNQTVVIPVEYKITCGMQSVTATLLVYVTPYNNPANVIDHNTECYYVMPDSIGFGIQRKFKSDEQTKFANDYIDGFSMPLVGDLNGDGKPEIVALGVINATGYQAVGKSIRILDGQTGDTKINYDISQDMGVAYTMGFPHRAPSSLALVDLDNDGTVEIIACNTATGNVVAFKPVFQGTAINTLNKMWETRQGLSTADKTINKGFKSPITDQSGEGNFCYPHPFIADLNGDNVPEIIVYNKIYSASGKLIMSWGGTDGTKASGTKIPSPVPGASEWKNSDYMSTKGYLKKAEFTNSTTQANSREIKAAAMTGRRICTSITHNDRDLPLPSIVDIDGDGQQEIITGNRIYKFHFNSMDDHTQNYYCMIEGPESVELTTGNGKETFYLNDGFTRVADIDGDGVLDIVVVTYGNNANPDPLFLVYVWDYNNRSSVKAALTYWADGSEGPGSIPFIGDINGKLDGWDGAAYTRKLPEIGILSGSVYIGRLAGSRRTGLKFHPKTDDIIRAGANSSTSPGDSSPGWNNENTTSNARKFNKVISGNVMNGHIITLTYDGNTAEVSERLKLSWAMEVRDRSQSTGITLFDFNNDNAVEMCYRDEADLYVISPKLGKRDYIALNENSPSILFKTSALSYTGYEAPVIADINLDGSADILVTVSPQALQARAWVETYQFKGQKWAPAPPVWNQAMFDPRQIREDLKINARPVSMLAPYTKNGETIYPYNGSWIQVPIVRDSADYIPIVRLPNAIIANMEVKVESTSETTVSLTIFNNGTSSIGALSPITFYDGAMQSAAKIDVQKVGTDIFPNEKRTLQYTLKGNFNNKLIWARIFDDSQTFPASGYNDCDLSNNAMAGAHCPFLQYVITASPNSVICGSMGSVLLSANVQGTLINPNDTVTYQWYRDEIMIAGATQQTYSAAETGLYKCYVTAGICRGFSKETTVTYQSPKANDDHVSTPKDTPIKIAVLDNDNIANCNPVTVFIQSQPTSGTATVSNDTITYTPDSNFSGEDEFKYHINGEDVATVRVYVNTLHALEYYACPDALVTIGLGFDDISGMTYKWYDAAGKQTGTTRTIQVRKDNSGLPQSWWAQATYRGNTYSRVEVVVNPSDNCGTPVGCAIDGTVLFREDFGGNSPADQRVSPAAPFSANVTDLAFSNQNTKTSDNTYWLLKYNDYNNRNLWHTGFSDHTFSGDVSRGYMLMIDATADYKKFYQYTMMDLCSNSRLFFSAWAANLAKNGLSGLAGDPSLKFEVLDLGENILAVFTASDIPRDNSGQLQWRSYGFSFPVPAGHNALILRIYNNSAAASGNDLVLDDIEIRLCVPPVSIANHADTVTVCEGESFSVTGSYFDDGSFGAGLGARWEYSLSGDINDESAWTPMSSMTYSSADTVARTFVISNVSASNHGYYRMAAAKAADASDMSGLDKYKCRAVSKAVYLKTNVCISSKPDYVSTPKGTAAMLDVAANDVIPVNCSPLYSIAAPPHHASSVHINSGILSYTPTKGFIGADSLDCSISCGNSSKTERIYIFVYDALAQEYVACPNASATMGFAAIKDVTYNWYDVQAGGTPVFSGNLYSVAKGSASDVGTWWVEPVFNGKSLARITVRLTESNNCGTTAPPECVQNGTLLLKEDFGGNDPNTPMNRSVGLGMVSGYTYSTSFSGNNTYIITKKNPVPPSQNSWYELTDHTYPNDPANGYFIGFDATADSGKFCEYTVNGLCDSTKICFSAWLASLSSVDMPDKASLTYIVEDTSGNSLARYYTGNLPDMDGVWKNYGFEFAVPAGKSSIKLKIINNGTGSSGNDFGLDDIEIRFCTSRASISGSGSIGECEGAPFELKASFTDSYSTFKGNSLVARWYKNTSGDLNDPLAWTMVGTEQSASGVQISHAFTVGSSKLSDAGWYRLAVADAANIDRYCCRAMSDIVRVKVRKMSVPPDVRLNVQPAVGTVAMNAYLDSLDYEYRIAWSPYSEFIDAHRGTLGVSGWHLPTTSTYTYDIDAMPCGTLTAKAYLHAVDSVYVKTETVYICKDLESSKSVNLNQILGIEAAGGTWKYLTDAHSIFSNNVFTAPPDSKHAGARFFNTQAAFTEATSCTDYDYEIDKKKFEFEYSNNTGVRKKVVLILWGKYRVRKK